MQSASQAGHRQLQRQFGAYLRQPEQCEPPAGVTAQRAAVYRELVFNNIKGFLDGNFPVLSAIVGETRWQQVAEQFIAEHPCQTPYFLEIGREFLTWFRSATTEVTQTLPFAIELAHYEWAELAIAVAEDEPGATFADANLLDTVPLICASAWALRYDYPVHLIGPEFLPDQQPDVETFLLVYRGADEEVHFIELNALTWLLIEQLRQDPTLTARQQLQAIAAQFPQLDPASVETGGEQTLLELRERGVIIGSRALPGSA